MNRGLWGVQQLLCLCVFAALPVCAQEAVKFVFQPPEKGISLIQTRQEAETEIWTAEDEAETRVTRRNEKIAIEIVKSATGYRYTETLIELVKETDDEEKKLNPLERAFLGMPIIYELDPHGRLLQVRGVEAVRERMLEFVEDEDEDEERFGRLLTREKMESLAREDWEAMTRAYLGQTRKPGESWQSTAKEMLFSIKTMPVTTQYSLQKVQTLDGRRCALVREVANPNLKSVAQDLRTFLENELEVIPKQMKAKYTVLDYTSESNLYLDTALLVTIAGRSKSSHRYQIDMMGNIMEVTNKTEASIVTEVKK